MTHEFLLFSKVGEIEILLRVILMIVKLVGDDAALLIRPLDVTPPRRAHRAPQPLPALNLAERRRFPRAMGLREQRREARAFHPRGRRQGSQFRERRIQINEFDQAGSGFAPRLHFRHAHQQRRARGGFIIAVLVSPTAVFAHLIAVVADDDDDGVAVELHWN